ncbi:UBX domain containing [Lecanosticta acicola]|uniref:UBX domain containing n=1 Tax=Lecanosticta acicola TaxID=111012 RepID=A0AAI8YS25_9PEZI|nr:UBX domain containing [Lecanosticta acicola]
MLFNNNHSVAQGYVEDDDDDQEYLAQAMREREEEVDPVQIRMTMPIRLRVPDALETGIDITPSALSDLLSAPKPDPPRPAERAKGPAGNPFPTVCFDAPLINHPHHHRLKCGHDIITTEIEVCGKNCMQLANGGPVPTEHPFRCPSRKCLTKISPLLPKDRKPLRRFARLSRVRGNDERADEERRNELEKPKVARKKPEVGPSDSETPEILRATRHNTQNVDKAEELNAFIDANPSWKVLYDFSGPGTMAKLDGKYMTKKDFAAHFVNKKMAKSLYDLQIANKEFMSEEAKEALRRAYEEEQNAAAHQDEEAEGSFLNGLCDCCGGRLLGVRFTCQECADVDFCNGCYMLRRQTHDEEHSFRMYGHAIGTKEIAAGADVDESQAQDDSTPDNTAESRNAKQDAGVKSKASVRAELIAKGRIQKANVKKEERAHMPRLQTLRRQQMLQAKTDAEKEAIWAKFQRVIDQQESQDVNSGESSQAKDKDGDMKMSGGQGDASSQQANAKPSSEASNTKIHPEQEVELFGDVGTGAGN